MVAPSNVSGHDSRARSSATTTLARRGAPIEASGWSGSFGAGLTYQVIEDELYAAVSYQSRPNPFTKREAKNRGIKTSGKVTTDFNGATAEKDATFFTDLPDVIRWGLRYDPSKAWEYRLSGSWKKWSNLVAQCVTAKDTDCVMQEDGNANGPGILMNQPRLWNDTWDIRAGASYFDSPKPGFGRVGSITRCQLTQPGPGLEPLHRRRGAYDFRKPTPGCRNSFCQPTRPQGNLANDTRFA